MQVDGAAEASFTHEPHGGIAWNISIWKPQDLKEVVRAFHDAGYQSRATPSATPPSTWRWTPSRRP